MPAALTDRTGVADRPRASRQVAQVPDYWEQAPERIGYLHPPEPPRDSDTQGLGKSPGFKWPWQQFWQGLRGGQAGGGTGVAHWKHELPSRILIAGERGPLSRHYLDFYEQAPRHAWPGGGVIEYAPSLPLVSVARRLGEPSTGYTA